MFIVLLFVGVKYEEYVNKWQRSSSGRRSRLVDVGLLARTAHVKYWPLSLLLLLLLLLIAVVVVGGS